MLFQVDCRLASYFFVQHSNALFSFFFLYLFFIIYLILWKRLNEQQSREHTHSHHMRPTIQCAVCVTLRCAFVWWRAFQTLLSPIHPALILPSIIHFIIILALRAAWLCACWCVMLVVYISWLFFYFFPPACCLSITFCGIVPTHHLINIVYNSVKVV